MRPLALLLIFAATVRCFSQGTVNFANAAGGVNAPLIIGGVPPLIVGATGPNWKAQLYAGPAGMTDVALLTTNGVSGTPATFSSGGSAGFFFGDTRDIDGFLPGTTVTLQVRAWTIASGPSWETAGLGARAESNLIQVTLGGGAIPTPNMVGLTFVVPEPSSYALVTMGLLTSLFLGLHRPTPRR